MPSEQQRVPCLEDPRVQDLGLHVYSVLCSAVQILSWLCIVLQPLKRIPIYTGKNHAPLPGTSHKR